MSPAAVLAVVVKAQGIAETNAKLASVQKTLEKTESRVTSVGNSFVKTGKKVTSVGKTLTRSVSVPLIGIGVAAGTMSAKFHRSMNLIATDAGGSKKEVKGLTKGVLEMAKVSEFGPQKLADALFYVESAGVRGKKALWTLNQIQKAAMAGNADLEHTTFGTVGAMNALGKEGKNVNKILAIMNATVGHGHMRLEELVSAISTGLVGTGKTFGLTFEGMTSAVAFFTRMSEPAQQAATRLKQTITHLASSSTKKGKEALESIGVSVDHMSESMVKTGRLGPVIKYLQEHLEGLSTATKNQILTEAFGGGRFGTQIREALANVGLLFKTEKEIAKTGTVKRLKHSERLQEETDAVKLKKLWSSVEVSLIKLGDAILPVIVPAFTKVVGWLEKGTQWFEHLSDKGKQWVLILGGVAIAFGPFVTILGKIITFTGWVTKGFGKIIEWSTKTTAASEEVIGQNDAVMTSYQEVATAAQTSATEQIAAIQEVTDAQKVAAAERVAQLPVGGLTGQTSMTQIMPAAEEGAQMSLFAQPVTSTAAKVGPEVEAAASPGILAAGKSLVGKFGGAIGFNLPTMIAGLGLANILSSAMGGDMTKAGEKGAGALAGGLIGMIGGPEGALIGAGIGSALGPPIIGAIKNLFGSGGPVETQLEHSSRGLSNALGKHLGRLQSAMVDFHGSTAQLHTAKDAAVKASNALNKAEAKLDNARHARKGSNVVAKDEAKVRIAKLGVERANRKVMATEELAGTARIHAMQQIRATIQVDKQRIKTSKNVIDKFYEELKVAQENGAGTKRLEHILKEITRAEEVQSKSKKNLTEQYKRANAISPEFAKAMHKVKTVAEETTEKERQLSKQTKGINLVPNTLQSAIQAWKRNKTQTEGATQAVHKATEKYGPFKTQSHNALHQATEDTKSWYKAGHTGITQYAEQMNSFASQLGIANVHFGISGKTKGKEPKKQQGGMIVSGAGPGDKVPLTALVEPGEMVHVLNRNATKDMQKLGMLEALNNRVPRRQEGGVVGGSATAAAMAEAQLINSKEYPYVWGGGHGSFNGPYDCSGAVSAVLHAAGLLDKPMVSGELANYGAPGPGPITIYANGVHAFMSIMGKFFGTSGSNPGGGAGWIPFEVGHGEAMQGDSGGPFAVRHPTGAGVMQLAAKMFEGPAGQLQKTGQESMDVLQKAGNKWLTKHAPGSWGGGDSQLTEALSGGTVASPAQFAQYMIQAGFPKTANVIAEGLGTIMAESAYKVNNAQGASGHIGPWAESPAFGSVKQREDPLGSTIAAYNVGWSPTHSFWPAWWKWEAEQSGHTGQSFMGQFMRTAEEAVKVKAQHGALLMSNKKGGTKKEDPVGKSIRNVLGGLRKGKHLPKYHGALKKLGRHINDIGLNDKQAKRLEHLGSLTDKANEYASFAENASTLTERIETEEGGEEIKLGVFAGKNESQWLTAQLHALMNLRKGLIGEYGAEQPQIPHLTHLIQNNKDHLHAVQKKIRELEEEKRALEKQIKEIERAAKGNKQNLEKEAKQIEHEIAEARRNMPPDDKAHKSAHEAAEKHIDALEKAKEAKQDGADHSEKQSNEEIRKINKHIHRIEDTVKGKQRVETALTGTIIPGLEGRRTSISELVKGVLGEGAEAKGHAFSGLEQVQGPGQGIGPLSFPPPITSVGGELFNVLHTLKEIESEKPKAAPSVEYTAMQYAELGLAEAELGGDPEAIHRAKEQILHVAEEDLARARETPSSEDDLAAIQEIQAAKASLEGGEGVAESLAQQKLEAERSYAREVALEERQRREVMEMNAKVMQEFPSISKLNEPFGWAGQFANGGVMMAEVGERGREIIAAPQGSRVVSSPEVKAAIASGSGEKGHTFNFEEFNYHEGEERVTGKVNGQTFDQKVRKNNRKQARSAMAWTPGGKKR